MKMAAARVCDFASRDKHLSRGDPVTLIDGTNPLFCLGLRSRAHQPPVKAGRIRGLPAADRILTPRPPRGSQATAAND